MKNIISLIDTNVIINFITKDLSTMLKNVI